MDWKISLDRWLTTPPDDEFTDYCEYVVDAFSEEFYDKNEDWIIDSEQSDKWLSNLYRKSIDPKEASKIIERAFIRYIDK